MTETIKEAVEQKLFTLINSSSLDTEPFMDNLNARRLLWIFGPWDRGKDGILLQGILNNKVTSITRKIFVKLLGDPSYFDNNGSFHIRPQYYEFEPQIIDDYYQNDVIQGSARMVFSDTLEWLLLITFDGYALLGATNTFMREIELSVPSLVDYYNQQDFIEYWEDCARKNGVDISWVSNLLTHINSLS